MLDEYHAQIAALDREEKQVVAHLTELVRESGSTLAELCGLSVRSVAELLVEVGDVRRFTEGGFARFNATAPLPASTAEGPGEPIRHRYNPGGNRRVNAVLHRMAITQLAREPRAQRIYEAARAPHQEGGPPRPQTPPLRRRLPPHDPRPPQPSHAPRPASPRCITARPRPAGKSQGPRRTLIGAHRQLRSAREPPEAAWRARGTFTEHGREVKRSFSVRERPPDDLQPCRLAPPSLCIPRLNRRRA